MHTADHRKRLYLPLYSKLVQWLENTPQKIAPYQQWSGMLRNQQGIRREEIERSGLLDMLPANLPEDKYQLEPELERPTKVDLLNEAEDKLFQCRPTLHTHWKKSYRPTLEVKTIHENLPKHIEARAKPFVDKAQTFYQLPSLGYWIIKTGYEDLMTVAPNWIILDPTGKLLLGHEKHKGWFPTAVEAFDEMHRVINMRFEAFGKDTPVALYEQYTFMGGNNYQEWFVCLPEWPLPYRDNHFNLDQLLIHIRTTERVDYDGRPLLMVEEIQSPWHADIRDHGSYTEEYELEDDEDLVADAPFGKEWHELAIKAVIWLAVKNGHSHIGFTTGKQQCARWGALDGLMNLYDTDIPKTLKKVASQYDCANDWATIVTRRPDGKIYYERGSGWIVKDTNRNPLTPPLKNKDVALHFLNQRGNMVKEPIRLLQISADLKRAMNAGHIPLFGW
jgi:hypothetical protein